jgi:hypothetical protein
MKPLSTSGELSIGAATRDGGLNVRIHTQELTPEQMTAMYSYHNKFGYILFKPNDIQDGDIPTEDVDDKDKTPSKRLRNVLYVLHAQSGKDKKEFEAFYRTEMEKVIDHFKKRIDSF